MSARVEMACPACAESVLVEAKKCKHCGVMIAEAAAQFAPQQCGACAEMTDTSSGTCTHCGERVSPGAAQTASGTGGPAQPWVKNGASPQTPPPVRAKPLKVSFGEAVALAFKNYATFDGRATRGEFWWFALFNAVIVWSLSLAAVFPGSEGLQGLFLWAYWGWVLATLVPYLALYARRLHDVDRSGWSWLWSLTIIGAIPVFIWFCTKGDEHANRFGPPRTE
jgi:uncharacterized membrane protein YhaH (DUF805 family)